MKLSEFSENAERNSFNWTSIEHLQ